MATLSLAVNLVLYFIGVMHMNAEDSSNLLTNYMGASYMIAVLISVFADVFVGRYMTVILSSLVELVARSDRLKPPMCDPRQPLTCLRVHGGNEVHLYLALYLIALGSGGIKAALPAHCADQFDAKHPKEKQQMSSCFNYLLLSLCTGGVVSVTLFLWIQGLPDRGWEKGFAAATGVMGLAVIVFIAGMPRYRIATVQGSSALKEICQVYVAAIRNRKQQLPEDPDELYEISRSKASPDMEFLSHRDRPFRFLDRAAIVQTDKDAAANPWRQCRVTQVEQAKTVLAMVPIFCSAIIMGTCLAQLQTFSMVQGSTMDTTLGPHFKMPVASMLIIPLGLLIFAVPIYEQLFVPLARRLTGIPTGITYLQRVGVGLVLSIVSMVIAAVVEAQRKKVATRNGMLDMIVGVQHLPMSCFWLAPQFAVFGIADMFTYVGLMEFFYSQAPAALKSMSSSFLWCSLSLGYFMSTIIVKAVNAATRRSTASGGWLAGSINRNHLDLFFWLLAVLSTLNLFNYLFWARWYKYRPQEKAPAAEEQQQQV
ncbi:hypothetical protein BDA96_03G319100 [Sorghum bicolor]|uniref:Uncharacterized protein n=1 Tax=Sorghum bicolor TaxID=4558 RepID=A0A921URS3_SORBI|nr:hypothetical protein BDA96_03G319100 [Sorghum bicolor]